MRIFIEGSPFGYLGADSHTGGLVVLVFVHVLRPLFLLPLLILPLLLLVLLFIVVAVVLTRRDDGPVGRPRNDSDSH